MSETDCESHVDARLYARLLHGSGDRFKRCQLIFIFVLAFGDLTLIVSIVASVDVSYAKVTKVTVALPSREPRLAGRPQIVQRTTTVEMVRFADPGQALQAASFCGRRFQFQAKWLSACSVQHARMQKQSFCEQIPKSSTMQVKWTNQSILSLLVVDGVHYSRCTCHHSAKHYKCLTRRHSCCYSSLHSIGLVEADDSFPMDTGSEKALKKNSSLYGRCHPFVVSFVLGIQNRGKGIVFCVVRSRDALVVVPT